MGWGGSGFKVSNCLPTDDLLSKVQSYNMAANTEQNGYLKDGHEHSFQK